MMTSINKLFTLTEERIQSNAKKCDRCGRVEKCLGLKCFLVFTLFVFQIRAIKPMVVHLPNKAGMKDKPYATKLFSSLQSHLPHL